MIERFIYIYLSIYLLKVKMAKKSIYITVDLDSWLEAKKLRINISEACNKGLIESLEMKDVKAMTDEELLHQISINEKKEQLEKELQALDGN